MEKHFFYCSEEVRAVWNHHNVIISKKFCVFLTDIFEKLFIKETGIKPSSKVSIGNFKQKNEKPMYEVGVVSKLNLVLWILPQFYDNISFCWKSKSGKIVHTYDEDFDETDLECWIEGLRPALYWKEVATEKKNHPFDIKDLPYSLKVFGFGMHMGLNITLSDVQNAEAIARQLADEVEKHNDISEAKDRMYGIVHNCSYSMKGTKIEFRIDVGSAGIVFIKKLLKLLTRFGEVKEVIVDL